MQAWLLVAGEYMDREEVAVVIGPKRDAEKAAEAITVQRVKAGKPDDMIKVKVEKIVRVDAYGKKVS